MGCSGSTSAAKNCMYKAAKEQAQRWAQTQQQYLQYLQARNAWQMILGTFVGIYALIRQYELFKEQLKIARAILRQQEDYLTLAKRHYNEITVPAFNRVRDLFDRYISKFAGYEERFMQDAFKYDEYTPEYNTQEARVLSKVYVQFDRAARTANRARGKYNAGRPCHNATWFASMRALAAVDAVNHAFRYEEAKKERLDRWFWSRKLGGATFETNLGNRAVSGLNRGVIGAVQGLNAVGAAYDNLIEAQGPLSAAYANLGNFWGSVANGAFRMAGYAYGMSQMPWAPPPYGGGSYGLYGPGSVNFGASTGMAVGGGSYSTGFMLGDNHGGSFMSAGGLAGGMSPPVYMTAGSAPAYGNWVGAPGYSGSA